MPDEVIDELAWGSEAILTSTAAAAILIHNDGAVSYTHLTLPTTLSV